MNWHLTWLWAFLIKSSLFYMQKSGHQAEHKVCAGVRIISQLCKQMGFLEFIFLTLVINRMLCWPILVRIRNTWIQEVFHFFLLSASCSSAGPGHRFVWLQINLPAGMWKCCCSKCLMLTWQISNFKYYLLLNTLNLSNGVIIGVKRSDVQRPCMILCHIYKSLWCGYKRGWGEEDRRTNQRQWHVNLHCQPDYVG